jgi:hypothetical protein
LPDIGADAHPRPWGYLATLGWATLAAALSLLVAVVVTLLWRKDIRFKPVDLLNDGALLSFSTAVWNVAQIVALVFIARLARWPPGEYLGLVRPNERDAGSHWSFWRYSPQLGRADLPPGRDIVPPVASYLSARTSGALPLLWFTFVVAPRR